VNEPFYTTGVLLALAEVGPADHTNDTKGAHYMGIGKWIAIGIAVFIGLAIVSNVLWFAGEANQVAKEEFGPRAMLEKYEWFKDAAAQLDAKVASIEVYEAQMKSMEESYGGEPRRNWTRDDREQYNQWSTESMGLKLSYNNLAAEYNSQMAKFNWRFANAGELPPGATKPLPREYKPYVIS